MVKGEILEITVRLMATEEIPDVDALTFGAAGVDGVLGAADNFAKYKLVRVSGGVSICDRLKRLARRRLHRIYGGRRRPDDPTPPPQSKPS
ncbi:MAG: hypothetical protein IVW54_16735 [Candidatus Binataceae bacterium]|nr:hypothetical protein [Candidatus Binataceae bacterium]